MILIKLIPITLKQANEFVLSHHRHHSKVQGCKFCVGVVDERNKIRGVAIVGRPVSRYLDNGLTAEVTRLCTDGFSNACSFLYGACARIAKQMGYERYYLIYFRIGTRGKSASIRLAGTRNLRWWKLEHTRQTKKQQSKSMQETNVCKEFDGFILTGGIKLEVKINREIRNYTESMFFGLSMRQFVFSVLAILVAVGLYFLLKPHFGTETVSWMCILGAAPFAALGFITYHGMTAEQFLWAWLRSELLEPKELRFEASNLYYEALKDKLEGGKS